MAWKGLAALFQYAAWCVQIPAPEKGSAVRKPCWLPPAFWWQLFKKAWGHILCCVLESHTSPEDALPRRKKMIFLSGGQILSWSIPLCFPRMRQAGNVALSFLNRSDDVTVSLSCGHCWHSFPRSYAFSHWKFLISHVPKIWKKKKKNSSFSQLKYFVQSILSPFVSILLFKKTHRILNSGYFKTAKNTCYLSKYFAPALSKTLSKKQWNKHWNIFIFPQSYFVKKTQSY